MIKNSLIKYIATLICALIVLSLFSCVAQPIGESGTDASSTDAAQVTDQEITSNSGVVDNEVSGENDGENKTEPDSDSEKESESDDDSETETETKPNYGMGFIPL